MKDVQQSRKQTNAMRRQSRTAEAALNASIRPLLVDVPRHTMRTIHVQERPGEKHPEELDVSAILASVGETTRTGSLVVPVRNVGAGVALGLAAAATFDRDAVGSPIARGEAPSVIAAGEPDAIWFSDTPGPPSVAAETPLVRLLREDKEDLVVEVAYSDVAGRQESATSLYLTKSGTTDRDYRVTRVVPGHRPRLTTQQLEEQGDGR
jgi:hypothetical protein